MPRYYFHLLHPDRQPVADEEGLLFEDDAAARREGLISLGEFMADSSKSDPRALNVSVQIDREDYGMIEMLTGDLSVLSRERPCATK